jgi:hypothetical protein
MSRSSLSPSSSSRRSPRRSSSPQRCGPSSGLDVATGSSLPWLACSPGSRDRKGYSWSSQSGGRRRFALRERWRAGRPGARRLGWADLKPVVALVIPAVAYGSYVAFTAVILHQPYFDSHAIWAATGEHLPWDAIGQAWGWAFQHHDPFTMLNVLGLAGFSILAVVGLRLLPASYSLYVFPQLVLSLTQQTVSPLMSTARYLLVLFPCFVVLAVAGHWRRFHLAWLLLSVLFLGLMTTLFLEGNFVG